MSEQPPANQPDLAGLAAQLEQMQQMLASLVSSQAGQAAPAPVPVPQEPEDEVLGLPPTEDPAVVAANDEERRKQAEREAAERAERERERQQSLAAARERVQRLSAERAVTTKIQDSLTEVALARMQDEQELSDAAAAMVEGDSLNRDQLLELAAGWNLVVDEATGDVREIASSDGAVELPAAEEIPAPTEPAPAGDAFVAPAANEATDVASEDDPFALPPAEAHAAVESPAVEHDDPFALPTAEAPTSPAPAAIETPGDDPFAPPTAAAPDGDPFALPTAAAPDSDPFALPTAAAPDSDPFALPTAASPDSNPFALPTAAPPDSDPFALPTAVALDSDPFAVPAAQAEGAPFALPVAAPIASDPFALPTANDPFAAPAPAQAVVPEDPFAIALTDDPFAIPAPSAPTAPTPPAEPDPFAAPAPNADPFSTSVPDAPTNDPFGLPDSDPFADLAAPVEPTPGQGDPFAGAGAMPDPFSGADALPDNGDPFAGADALLNSNDPFAGADALPDGGDPFAGADALPGSSDPFAGADALPDSSDPFAAPSRPTPPPASFPQPPAARPPSAPSRATPTADPFAVPDNDPFAVPAGDPFAAAQGAPIPPGPVPPSQADPFAAVGGDDATPMWASSGDSSWDPAASTNVDAGAPVRDVQPSVLDGGDDPFGGYDEPNLPVVAGPPMELEAVDLVWAGAKAPQREDEASSDAQLMDELVTEAQQMAASDSRRNGKKTVRFLPFERIREGDPAIFAFASPKGGSGKSSTALNFAASIAYTGIVQAKEARRQMRAPRVLLIDGDIGDGSLSVRVIGKPPRNNEHAGSKNPETGLYEADEIPSLLSLINYIDDKAEEGFMDEPASFDQPVNNSLAMRDFVLARDTMPNLHVLAAPDEPDFVSDMEADEYKDLLKRLGKFYDIIVLDCGTEMWAHYNQVWYQSAHAIFVMMSPDLATLNSCRKFIRYITRGRQATKRTASRPAMTTRDKLHLVMLNSNASTLRIKPKETAKKMFRWARPEQLHFFGDFKQEMDQANNAQEFLAMENRDYGAEVAELAQAALASYVG